MRVKRSNSLTVRVISVGWTQDSKRPRRNTSGEGQRRERMKSVVHSILRGVSRVDNLPNDHQTHPILCGRVAENEDSLRGLPTRERRKGVSTRLMRAGLSASSDLDTPPQDHLPLLRFRSKERYFDSQDSDEQDRSQLGKLLSNL